MGGGEDYNPNYLTIYALENGLELSVYLTKTNTELSYSFDNGDTWEDVTDGYILLSNINSGETVAFKGELTGSAPCMFFIDKYCNIMGNCNSLLFGNDAANNNDLTGYDGCFSYLFAYNNSIVDASKLVLPATTLANNCYNSMFQGCTSLTTAPELPATTLAKYCYNSMFSGCTSLVIAPELPATNLADRCYDSMFCGCSSLTTAPELPATTLADGCYDRMFEMCTSLTTAPELPATTLADGCYSMMFYNCGKLNYIKMLATDISVPDCLNMWVEGVSPTGTFVKNKNATWNKTGDDGIPSRWTVLTE